MWRKGVELSEGTSDGKKADIDTRWSNREGGGEGNHNYSIRNNYWTTTRVRYHSN